MIRYLLRRLFLMIPVFFGITLATFGLLSLGEDTLGGRSDEAGASARPFGAEEIRRAREALGYDLPAFLNTDVKDARRTVEVAAERVADTWPRVAGALTTKAFAAARATGMPELDASAAALRLRDHVYDQVRRGRPSSAGLLVATGRGARSITTAVAPFETEVLDLIADQSRLRRLGGQTVMWGLAVIKTVDDGPTTELLVESARVAGALKEGAGVEDLDQLKWDAERDGRWEEASLIPLVDRWFAAAEAEVAATGEGGDTARHEAARTAAQGPLARAGGLMMSLFVPRLLASSPWVNALAAELVVESGGADLRFEAYGGPGETLSPDQAALHALQLDRLRRWWGRNSLRYREVSGFERWGWFSWKRTRYARWLGSVITLDWGESLHHSRSVRALLAERLPFTLLLQGCALVVMYLLSVPLGTWAAVRRGRWVDRVLAALAFLAYAAPTFWVATLLVLGMGGVFPMSGMRSPEIDRAVFSGALSPWSWTAMSDLAWHCVLPVFVLAYGGTAVLQRFARASVLETLQQPWVRAARARGVSERLVLRRHVLRPALTPLITLFGVLLPGLVAGSVVVESIFGIPGMGLLAWEAVLAHDVPVVMAVVTLSAVATMFGYVISDLLYAWADPRVRR